MGHVCCHNGLADFSKTQVHHPNAQPHRWLHGGPTEKPRRSGAKSVMWAAKKPGGNSAHTDTIPQPVAQRAVIIVTVGRAGYAGRVSQMDDLAARVTPWAAFSLAPQHASSRNPHAGAGDKPPIEQPRCSQATCPHDTNIRGHLGH